MTLLNRFALAVAVSALAVSGLAAQASPKATPEAGKGDLGLLVKFQNVSSGLLAFEDGVQQGVGVKYWLKDDLALRGLLGLYLNAYKPEGADETELSTTVSLGAGLERHRPAGKASPYAGGFAGVELEGVSGTAAFGCYAGAMAGIEYRILSLSTFFVEYQLLCRYDLKGLTVTIGNIEDPLGALVCGLCFYFR